MLKSIKEKWPIVALVGLSTLSVGLVVGLLKNTDAFDSSGQVANEQTIKAVEASPVLGLVRQSFAERESVLRAVAQRSGPGDRLESDRARFMLATDLLNQSEPAQALPLLEGLENSYDALAPYVLLRRAQAHAALDQRAEAEATWQQLSTQYSESPAAAKALYQLGLPASGTATSVANAAPSAWVTLLQNYPSHPLSVEVAFKLLSPTAQSAASSAPPGLDNLTLLKTIAYHGLEHPQYVSALNRLVSNHSSALTPEDWAAVGFGYWENQVYGKAGDAYAKAPGTPRRQYRAARGKERGGKIKEAIALYTQLNQNFPDSLDTADGLLNLSRLQDEQAAMATLDQLIARFPTRAGDALVEKANLFEELKSPESAKQAKASILSQYSDSEAAAEIRLKQARANAEKGDFAAAISWADQLIEAAPNDKLAAEAGFLLGKWTYRQNQPDVARNAFEQVIKNHPESYYAWRSAVYLDWNVGNFDTVRDFDPEISLPARRMPLPTGSEALQELYLLGQNQTAWRHWQTEFADQQMPTVAQQFTDGVLRLGIGDNLDGIFMVTSLAWREEPAEVEEYKALKNTPEFWQAIYPFPFPDLILGWAAERDINPLLVTALVRQESRFQPNIRSVVGAVGLMQVMPETGAWISQQIGQDDYSLDTPADNVKFGTWYLDSTHREFGNNSLFAVASYNAGPGAVDSWIQKGDFSNADEFVEKIPYPETKGYVEKVLGGYWNYLRLYDPEVAAKVNAL